MWSWWVDIHAAKSDFLKFPSEKDSTQSLSLPEIWATVVSQSVPFYFIDYNPIWISSRSNFVFGHISLGEWQGEEFEKSQVPSHGMWVVVTARRRNGKEIAVADCQLGVLRWVEKNEPQITFINLYLLWIYTSNLYLLLVSRILVCVRHLAKDSKSVMLVQR